MEVLEAIYKNSCPNCGGDICSFRLAKGIFCKNCMEEGEERCAIPSLKNFAPFCETEKTAKEFFAFFESKVGSPPNPVQKMWAKRFFAGSSFAMLAPTGIGKTTFGMLLAAFLGSAYLIFPTKVLVKQAKERFEEWGFHDIRMCAYTGKSAEKEQIAKGDYDILITTSQFLYRNKHLINKRFKLVFTDDVDSVLKSARRINDLLSLLGFSEEDTKSAMAFAKAKNYEALEKLAQKKNGNLIVSSATANPRSSRVKLFMYLLHFEVSRPSLSLRNIADLYERSGNIFEETVRLLKVLGRGGLVFLPGNETKETLHSFIRYLNENGVNAASYEEFEEKKELFKKGQCVFVGFASYRNPLARGVDLPQFVRYAIFAGVPKVEFYPKSENYRTLYFVLLTLIPFLAKNKLITPQEVVKLQKYADFLKKWALAGATPESVKAKLDSIKEEVLQLVERFSDEIARSPEIAFDGEKIVVSDVTGYVQASGRTSRFYKRHLTKGVSILLVDSEKAFYSLKKKLRWFGGVEFEELDTNKLKKLMEEVDRSRSEGGITNLKTSFVVVESPTKAKTISSFFGKPMLRIVNGTPVYEVLTENGVLLIAASVGHDYDLTQNEGKYGILKKYVPIFEVIQNKDAILKAFNLTAFETDEVIVATDPDREGEKISFDLTLANKAFNGSIYRAEFHEVSKRAFTEAVNHLREVDTNLVASQFVRRIADRWVGYEVSQFLQNALKKHTLSAGRVQTPVLKWIAERTAALSKKVWAVKVRFNGVEVEFTFNKKEDAEAFSKEQAVTAKKKSETEKELFVTPFNTSAMLRESAEKYGFSPQKTMKIAQELFENGFITYHRTDSTRVSQNGINIAKEYISENFGSEYFVPRAFSKSAGAHECIRPVMPLDAEDIRTVALMRSTYLSGDHIKLYDLIFRRFIASQMKSVKVKETEFYISGCCAGKTEKFLTEIMQHGFDIVYPVKVTEVKEGTYPAEKMLLKKSAVPPLTCADLIEMMKTRGIGRPSTYAVTVQKLFERKYIKAKGRFIFATKLGFKVLSLIEKSRFAEYVSEEYTARLESEMDKVEAGEADYKEVLSALYTALFPNG